MGVNYKIVKFLGVKSSKDYNLDFVDEGFGICGYDEGSDTPYYIGTIINSTHDFRYDGYDHFEWDVGIDYSTLVNVRDNLLNLGIAEDPKLLFVSMFS